jgi:uncharacterized cupredoxin-like copper-binding protein
MRFAQLPRPKSRVPRLVVAVVVAGGAAVALPLAALSSSPNRVSTRTGRTSVRVTERDFRISAPKLVAAGDVNLVVRNNGPDTHELIVVRGNGARLPLRRDGLTVDEEAVLKRTAASLDGGAPGSVRRLSVHLAPGRYVLFCNMAGHYLGGMHTELVVR